MNKNLQSMLQLVGEFFDVKNDPSQLNVDEHVLEKLTKIHPAALSEVQEDGGPVVWILMIPVTDKLMNRFLKKEISEQELFDETRIGDSYDAIYLCSASVLPEWRNKGLAKKTAINAIEKIRSDHPIKKLFYWPFSKDGEFLAKSISKTSGLHLLERI